MAAVSTEPLLGPAAAALVDESATTTLRRFRPRPRVVLAGLLAILFVAAGFRLLNVNWDSGQHLHPDERFIVMVDTGIAWPASLGEYFDSGQSPLNPYNRGFGNFVYGTLPIFLLKAAGTLLHRDNYDDIVLVGRVLSALSDLGSVLLLFFIGRRLYDVRVGLLASAFLALSVLGIQLSHFMAVDTFTVFFLLMSVYFATRVAYGEGWESTFGMGFAFGLALACKLSIALMPIVMVTAIALRIYGRWPRSEASPTALFSQRAIETGSGGQAGWKFPQGESLLSGLWTLLLALIAALVAFRIFQPYAFSGLFSLSAKWLQDEAQQQAYVAGTADVPFLLQWAHTTPILFPIKDIVVWGMGWPLGLLCFSALVAACIQIVRRQQFVHLVPVLWIVANLAYLGIQQSKTMRYFYQLYPFLALLGAWLLVGATRRGRDSGENREAGLSVNLKGRLTNLRQWNWRLGVGAFVVCGTALYAFAFSRIYTQPNTRIAASNWIYQNILPGSTLAVEHWDDALPLNLPGASHQSAAYKQVTLNLYDDDNPAKIQTVVKALQDTNYIVMSSNRLYGSIPRIPQRYPMTTVYYQALFAGQLGFKLVRTEASYPTLFGFEFNDDRVMGYQGLAAQLQPDEAFTVYDHPKVSIFQKTSDFSADNVRQLLSSVPLDNVQHLNPKQASLNTTQLTLSPADSVADQAGGTWSQLFDRGSWENKIPPVAWWAALELIGLLAFPLVFLAFKGFWDGGWLLAKPAGLLLLAYLSWIVPSLHLSTYTRGEITVALAVLAVAGLVAALVQRSSIKRLVKQHWRRLLGGEVLFLGLFAFFFLIRSSNPDLWHPTLGGEKPMDFAFLNASIKTSYFPPYDPWFAGGYINYYYFGFVIVGTLTKLLGIVPAVAYNLAVPLLPALTGIGAFSIVTSLAAWGAEKRVKLSTQHSALGTPMAAGLAAVIFIAIMGNLGEIALLYQGLLAIAPPPPTIDIPGIAGITGVLGGIGQLASGHPLPFRLEWWYWNASRVIPDTINEFPFFTFIYGDLHAHAIALPFGMLAVGAGAAMLLPTSGQQSRLSAVAGEAARLAMLGLAIGALKATNTWDYPTYLVLTAAVLVLADVVRKGHLDLYGLWRGALETGIVLAIATVLFWPYSQHFATLYNSIQLWTGARSALGPYIIIHGIFLFAISAFLLYRVFGPGSRVPTGRLLRAILNHRRRPGSVLRRLTRFPLSAPRQQALLFLVDSLLLVTVVLAALAVLQIWLPLLLVLLLALTASILFSPGESGRTRFTCLLIGLGLSLSLASEFLVVAGDVGRMNTVFKLDYQTWALWSLASALALYDIATSYKLTFSRNLVVRLTGVLVACGLLYTFGASIARAHDRFTPLPLTDDGQAYMSRSTWQDQRPIPLKPDAEAITWLQDNVQGSPVILEGRGKIYSWASRISIYTGLPTVLGWDWHEIQQRGLFGTQEIDRRAADVTNMYSNPSLETVLPLLNKYNVKYVYVGGYEQEIYPAAGLAKFSSLKAVYDRDGTKIYEVGD